jgi:hypothetical protein
VRGCEREIKYNEKEKVRRRQRQTTGWKNVRMKEGEKY